MSVHRKIVDFNVRIAAWPNDWADLVHELKFHSCKRSTEEFPIWKAHTESGFCLYLSEVQLVDSSTSPPKWRIRLESLSLLPSAGETRWEFVVSEIKNFLSCTEMSIVNFGSN